MGSLSCTTAFGFHRAPVFLRQEQLSSPVLFVAQQEQLESIHLRRLLLEVDLDDFAAESPAVQ
jgi:hypothetical protein